MESATIDCAFTDATIENLKDLWEVRSGRLQPESARRLIVVNAVVDTGTRALSLPTRLIQQLGLDKRYMKRATTSDGPVDLAAYEPVRLTIMGRDCTMDVMEVPDFKPVSIGRIPLVFLDFVVDPVNQRLIGNPEHGGEHVLELY